MATPAVILITLGALFLVGLLTNIIGRRTPVPRVSALLLMGFLLGPSALDLMPDLWEGWFSTLATMALLLVGFLLGSSLTRSMLKECGKLALGMSVSVVLGTALMVGVGLWFVGVPPHLALLLGGLATSTAPAATLDVARELKAKGPFTRTVKAIVAIDDAWGLIVFSIMLVAAQAVTGAGFDLQVLWACCWDIGGALLLGLALGIPMSWLTGRIRPGEPSLLEALGVIFLCGGVSLLLDVSFLLASMTVGIVVAHMGTHHARPSSAIERVQWPIMVLFFVFAGASVRLENVPEIAGTAAVYVALRIAGRFLGTAVWGGLIHLDRRFRGWMAMALMPQAGVALGMALIASQQFPGGDSIITVVVTATVFFEIIGPICTRQALRHMGEVPTP